MGKLSAFEAKTRFGEVLRRVAEGEEIVITRHDKPVARIIPEGKGSRDDVRHAVDQLKALQARIASRSSKRLRLSDDEVRSAIEEGRL